MKSLLLSLLLVFGLLLSTACTLVGVKEWNAYQVTIEVKNTSSQLIENASVTSAADKTKKMKTPGTYSLLYAKTGIHVVTISAPNKQTKQIKLTMPADREKIMTVILKDS